MNTTITTTRPSSSFWLWALGFVLLALALVVYFFDFSAKGTLSMPEVRTEGGSVPDVSVKGPNVHVEQGATQMRVPTDVDVKTKETTVTYPKVEVDRPADQKSNVQAQ